jgi:hypothetical protein
MPANDPSTTPGYFQQRAHDSHLASVTSRKIFEILSADVLDGDQGIGHKLQCLELLLKLNDL